VSGFKGITRTGIEESTRIGHFLIEICCSKCSKELFIDVYANNFISFSPIGTRFETGVV
jgi:hypothetical protein